MGAKGPPPNPQSRKQTSTLHATAWVELPREGRKDLAPAWPLPGQSDREAELWVLMWLKPQAFMWERLAQDFEVALYVRRLAEAELPGSAVNLGTLVKQMSDNLGLTVSAMLRNRWRIVSDEVGQTRETKSAPKSKRLFTVVDDAVARG